MDEIKYLHSKGVAVKCAPRVNSISPLQLHRVQSLAPAFTRPNEPLYELGREDEMTRVFETPEITTTLTAFEYGTIRPWALFASKDPASAQTIDLFDMENSPFDLFVLKKNPSNNLYETLYLPKCYANSFSLGIADKDARLIQTWGLANDDKMTFAYNNKHILVDEHTITAGEAAASQYNLGGIPTLNPDTSKYSIYAVKISGSVQTTLVEGTDFTVSGNTVSGTMAEGDTWVIHYTSSSGSDFDALDDLNPYFIKADQCDFLLVDVANPKLAIARLQSATINVSINRTTYGELGNKEIVSRPITVNNVSIELGKLATDVTLDEVLRGKQAADQYGVIDIRKYIDTLEFWIKVYTDNSKGTFLCKYIVRNIKPTAGNTTINVNDLATSARTLEASYLAFSTQEAAS